MTEEKPPSDGALDDDEREELRRLRAKVADLESRPESRPAASRGGRWRAVTSAVLIVVACLLAPLSLVAIWSNSQVSDTDRYVASVAPLARTASVQSAIANRVTTVVDRQLDVQGLLDEAVTALQNQGLPERTGERLKGLAGPIESAVNGFVHDAALRLVKSDEFATLWERANRAAHTQLTAVLSGEGSKVLKVQGDTVSIDLGPIIERLKQRLVAAGLTIAGSLPAVHPTFELFASDKLVQAQTAYSLLNTVAWVLPLVVLVLLVAGIAVARNHRRTALIAALGVLAAMLVLALGLVIGRTVFTNVVAAANATLAADVYALVVDYLRTSLQVVAVVALLTAAILYLAGPADLALQFRSLAKRTRTQLFPRKS